MKQNSKKLYTILFSIFALLGIVVAFMLRQGFASTLEQVETEKQQKFLVDSLTTEIQKNSAERATLISTRDFFIRQLDSQFQSNERLQNMLKRQTSNQRNVIVLIAPHTIDSLLQSKIFETDSLNISSDSLHIDNN